MRIDREGADFGGDRVTHGDEEQGGTGNPATRQMRASGSNRGTPIVMISDDQRPGAVSEGFEAGASFFLYKPVDKDRLQKLVRATQATIESGMRRTRRVELN